MRRAKEEKENKEDEEKLSFFQKRKIKSFIKKYRKDLKKQKKLKEDDKLKKEKLVESILSLTEVFTITLENGKEADIKELKKLSKIELIDLLEEILEKTEKELYKPVFAY